MSSAASHEDSELDEQAGGLDPAQTARTVAEYSLAVLVGLLPVLFSPFGVDYFTQPKATLVWLVAAVLIGAWLAEGLLSGRLRWARTPVDPFVAFLLVWLVVATVFSLNPARSLVGPYKWREGLVTLISYFVIFYGAATYLKGKALKRVLIWGGVAAALVSLYAIAQRFGLDVTAWPALEPGRAQSTLGSPAYLAAFTVLATPVAVGAAVAFGTASKMGRGAAFLAILLTAAAATSFSRSAWLGLALALVLLALLAPRRAGAGQWAVILVLIGLVMAAIPVAGQAQSFGRRVASITSASGANAARVELWRGAAQLTLKDPVTGVGPEMFRRAFTSVKPADWSEIDPEDKSDRAHSDALHVAATAGIPALLAYLGILGIILARGVWVLWSGRGREAAFGDEDGHEARRSLIAGLVGAAAGYVLFLQLNFTMVEVTALFWVVCGVLVGGTSALGTQAKPWEVTMPAWLTSDRARSAAVTVLIVMVVVVGLSAMRPLVADAAFRSALQHEQAGAFEETVAALKRASAWAPSEDLYVVKLGAVYAVAARQSANPELLDESIAAYERGLALNPGDKTIIGALAQVHLMGAFGLQREADLEPARDYYERLVEMDSNDADAWERLGDIALEEGRPEDALRYYEVAAKAAPADEARLLERIEKAKAAAGGSSTPTSTP